MRVCGAAILAVVLWVAGIEASYYGIDYDAKATYFNYEVNGVSQYVLGINPTANGDVYFHMSGPVTYSWLGVGFGSEMADSFMLISYPSADGKKVITSPRIATGHNEPTYAPEFVIEGVFNDTYAPNANTVTDNGKGTIIAHAVCRNCTKWATGSLETRNTKQPFLFALGPQRTFRADSPSASIPRHGLYGRFNMDMTEATNYTGWYGRVPAPNVPHFVFPPDDTAFASFGSSQPFGVEAMSNPSPTIHGVLMCVAFVLLFPAGAIFMQFFKQTLTHAGIQVVGFVFVLAGFGTIINIARQYNKSKDFDSAHQVIGLIIVAGLIIQLGLGLMHHAMYMRTNKPTALGRVHFFLGPFIMVLGLINGGVGFNFAGNSHLNVPYAIIVIIIALAVLMVAGIQIFCRSRRKYKPQKDTYQYPQFGPGGYTDEHEMSSRQPTFGEQPPEPYEPTTPYTPTTGKFVITSPYSPTTPYTPLSAYTPATPKTWRKEEITNWPLAPYKEYD